MKKKIAILSDLHLESSNINLNLLDCDVIVLAGDISQDFSILYNFFSYNIPTYIPIIYIPGNHEYEGKKSYTVMEELKKLSNQFDNVHILQNESIDIEGIHFIGTTLWSNFEGSGITWKEEVKKWARFNIVDFSYIFKKNQNKHPNAVSHTAWTPDDMEEEFNKAYKFLSYELKKKSTNNPKFVITHFAPTKLSLHPQYGNSLNNAYWVNDIPELMGFADYWIHGHTHTSFNYDMEGTQVICNPRGYSKAYDLSQNNFFKKDFYIEIDVPENNIQNKIKP